MISSCSSSVASCQHAAQNRYHLTPVGLQKLGQRARRREREGEEGGREQEEGKGDLFDRRDHRPPLEQIALLWIAGPTIVTIHGLLPPETERHRQKSTGGSKKGEGEGEGEGEG